MSVYKDKRTGNWCFKFVKNGVQYHRCFKGASQDEVIGYEARLRSDLLQGKYEILDNQKDVTLASLISEYKDYCRTNYVEASTFYYVLDNFYKLTGNKTLKQIGVNDIEKYKKARVNKVANSSINRELNCLSKMFSIAVENKYIQINPCLGVKRLRIENKPDRFLSIEEEKKLLESANPNLRLIILVALYTGMRQGEILNLKWKDLNLKEKYIKVLKTKNNKVRKIPLAQTLEEEFLKLPKLSEYVICNPLTRTKYNNIHKVFDATVKRAKIEHITFHQLRHSAATRMVEKGIDLVVVKEILGHADLSTTQKYSHPVPQRMLDAINELERYSSPISRKEE